jgi:hypothetical protein
LNGHHQAGAGNHYIGGLVRPGGMPGAAAQRDGKRISIGADEPWIDRDLPGPVMGINMTRKNRTEPLPRSSAGWKISLIRPGSRGARCNSEAAPSSMAT